MLRLFALLLCVFRLTESGCPFQNPFWFVDKPGVVSITDENNEIVPNKVRVMWGRLENFKCVDYFQVEYFQKQNPQGTVQITPKINRHRRSVEIDVVPCTEYFFKVIASEDWKGMREDFKMFSDVVSFRLQYTPQFITAPMVKERGRARYRPPPMEPQRWGAPPKGWASDDSMMPTPPPENFMIKVGWSLNDIDYPQCLDYFVLEYYDTMYNESGFTRSFGRPFQKPKFELEVQSTVVPCEPDYEFIVRAFGLNGQHSRSHWTPPSCIVTTPPPTTTTEAPPTPEVTTESWQDKMAEVEAENARLQAKIDGLKQEYEKIGLQVYLSFKEDFFNGLQDFLARRNADDDGFVASGNDTQPLFG